MKKLILATLCLFLTAATDAWSSRVFNRTAEDRITSATPVVTAAPFTICAWGNSGSATVDQTIVAISTSGSNNHRYTLAFAGAVADDPIRFVSRTDASSTALTTTSYSTATWHLACANEVAANDHRSYLDGSGEGTAATTRTLAGVNLTTIGALVSTSVVDEFSGSIAEVAIWNRTLTPGERASLAKGVSANCFRNGLVMYVDLIREIRDEIKGISLTDVNGTTVGAHPRIFYCH